MKKAVFPHELIGEEVVVVTAANPALLGISGKIVDETKATIRVLQEGGIKTLLKSAVTFKLVRTGKVIDGKTLLKRPEDRLKG
ncbi:MAG TPA: ribonuclease P protein subunit [Candidatus Nanoarchaeia archaeon]|nr:ribonuclease P protein subunit [Candidatus Nanoarchaeia archaeon]